MSRVGRQQRVAASAASHRPLLLLLLAAAAALVPYTLAMKGRLVLSSEKKLIKHLLDTYEASGIVGRPVNSTDEAIEVQFIMCLIQILDLDEQNQIMTVSTWNRYRWHDYLLAWNPDDYDGISSVRVTAHSIWKPDIVLYNYADSRLKEHRDALVTVSSDGGVYWIPPAIYKSSCSIDITNFPFDYQTCHFKFGSWSYDGLKLDIMFFNNYSHIDLGDFVPSNEWDVVSHKAERNVVIYPCCSEPFPDLTFTLVLRRKVAFYSYILVLPCILLSLMVMVLFWIPPDSPAKVQLGINVFVAFFLLLLLLANNTPSGSSSIPLIGVYYCANMVLITCSTFLSMFIVRLYIRFERRNAAPRWLVKIVLCFLAKALLMRAYVPKTKPVVKAGRKMRQELRSGRPVLPAGCGSSSDAALAALVQPDECPEPHKNNNDGWCESRSRDGCSSGGSSGGGGGNSSCDNSPSDRVAAMVQRDVSEIRSVLRLMAAKQEGREEATKTVGEWRAIALVIDRLFFIFYVLTVIITVAVVFPKTLLLGDS